MLIQDQAQHQQQRIDPKIILANTLLQLSGMEFQQAIEQELAENPALEQDEDQPCVDCELAPFMCKDCRYGGKAEQPEEDPSSDELTLHDFERIFECTPDPEEYDDLIGRIQDDLTLEEHLRTQLRNSVSGKMYEIGDYLINYINEKGYLECDLLELILEVDATEEEIKEAASIIRTLDPPGVGARDLRECLMIQLRYLAEEGKGNRIAERIVRDFWDDMKSHQLNKIARRLKVKPEQIKDALKFIRTKLNPYPASSFRSPWDSSTSDTRSAVRPDVIIRRLVTGYEIEIAGNEHLSLAINSSYRKIYNEIRTNGHSAKHSAEEKKHIMEYVERADLFIKNLNQRRKTLRNITKCITEIQQGFLETSSRAYLRPLTRVRVAEILGIHESTVSRATSGKYCQLPNEEVVPFDFFFQSSPTISDMLSQLIAVEDTSHPLSDQELADILTERGHPIARRTVVKYREARKILSSRQRRR